MLAQKQMLKRSEYERAAIIRSRAKRALREELEAQKPVHHHVFSRVFFKPDFPDQYEPTDLSKCNPFPERRPKPWNWQRTGVIAEKIGMTSLFDSKGQQHAVTILKMDAVQVVLYKGI